MMTTLVVYASKHGATEGIAHAIADRLRECGIDTSSRPVHEVHDLDGVDSVVLGSAIYAGSWMHEATAFARSFRDRLAAVPVWLFSSGPPGSHVDDTQEQPKQLDELRETMEPEDHQLFFGALDPESLSFGERMIVKAVKAPTGDFRDWVAIREWTDLIADELS
jgi:menaquinone-dependent protoporphyrinogen oxidase